MASKWTPYPEVTAIHMGMLCGKNEYLQEKENPISGMHGEMYST